MLNKMLNKIFRYKNKYRETEDYIEVVLEHPDTEREVVSKIDKEEFKHVKKHTWRLTKNGYATNRMVGYLHRFILKPEDDLDVDHVNRDKLDNRKSNLRECTRSQNMMNTTLRSNNTSGVTGVSYCKQTKKWSAMIKINYKTIWLGRHATLDEAIEVRRNAEKKYFKEYRVSN